MLTLTVYWDKRVKYIKFNFIKYLEILYYKHAHEKKNDLI